MTADAKARVLAYAANGARLREQFFAEHADLVVETAKNLADALARGNKILFCGNGGSAADAQHLAAELVNRFIIDRRPLAAVALTTDTSILTAVGNDFDFDQLFAKQVQALGVAGDVLFGISTSGNSRNVIRAMQAAREQSMVTVGLTGPGGGRMAACSDILIPAPGKVAAVVQEIHITVGHLLCGLVDYFLFGDPACLGHADQEENDPLARL